MRKIIEKFFLALASYFIASGQLQGDATVAYLLIVLSLSLVLDFPFEKWMKILIFSAEILLFVVYPDSLYFYPLFVYSSLWLSPQLCISSLLLSPFLLSPMTIVSSLLAAYLAYQSKSDHDFRRESVKIQDNLTQDKISLRRKQQQLEQDQAKNMEIATLSERNRIAHTLHDSIGHLISSSILQLEALQITSNEAATIDRLELLSGHLQSGMTDIRQTLHQLYNESFDLRQRLEEKLAPIENRELNFQYGIETVLPLSVKLDLVTIVKELVTNCCKHSNSDQVRLVLVEQPGFFSLSYRDNGTIQIQGEKGLGILSIEEIAHKYQGTVNVDQTAGYSLHLIFRKEAIEE